MGLVLTNGIKQKLCIAPLVYREIVVKCDLSILPFLVFHLLTGYKAVVEETKALESDRAISWKRPGSLGEDSFLSH